MSGPDGEDWRQAMTNEYESLTSKKTWTLVEPPPNAKIIGRMWILREKFEPEGKWYKARFVARGFTQKQCDDFSDTYAPVVHQSSVRLLMSHAVNNEMKLFHIDVKTAYLNSELTETIYIRQPYLFERGDGLVCKLNKAIYGLKQAAKCWNDHLTQTLNKYGLKQLLSDLCIFTNKDRSTIIAVYVDDLLILAKNESDYIRIRDRLAERFDITDKGQVKQFLGMQIRQSNIELTISQVPYIDLFKRFNMNDCKTAFTPIPSGTIFEPSDDDADCDNVQLYQSIVGSLIYLANGSRPDTQFRVNKLCKYMASPKAKHLDLGKRIIRYLRKCSADTAPISIYCDSDYPNDKLESKSISGAVVWHYGNLSRWTSHTQPCVARSTCEAETNAIKEASMDALYFISLIRELEQRKSISPIDVWNDNQPAIKTLEGGGQFARNRHYLNRINFIKLLVKKNIISVKYRQTDLMLADPLTKPLTEARSKFLFTASGMIFGWGGVLEVTFKLPAHSADAVAQWHSIAQSFSPAHHLCPPAFFPFSHSLLFCAFLLFSLLVCW